MKLLIKDARIVCNKRKDLHGKTQDILIENGFIKEIGNQLKKDEDALFFEREGLHISLGWIDTGVAFGEPGFEERETIKHGLKVAGLSGFTSILLNPSSEPVPDKATSIGFLRDRASRSAVNLYPLGTLSMGSKGVALAELYDMKLEGAVAFYDYKKPIAHADLLKLALEYVQPFNGLVCSFPVDSQLMGKGIVNEGANSTRLGLKGIPAMAEEIQLSRDLQILEYTGGKLHIPNISSAGSIKLISEAKEKGLDVSCGVSLANLVFNDDRLSAFNTNYKLMPPLRTESDRIALIEAVKDGTIDFVTSDHQPMDIEQKKIEFDSAEFGTIALEFMFGSLLPLFGLEKTVDLLQKGYDRFGIDAPSWDEGSAACFTLFDPNPEGEFGIEHIESTSKNAAFVGTKHQGRTIGVYNNARLLVRD